MSNQKLLKGALHSKALSSSIIDPSGYHPTHKNKKVIKPSHQTLHDDSKHRLKLINFNSSYSSVFGGSQVQISEYLESQHVDVLHDLTLRIKLTTSSSSDYLMPAPFWLDRIEYYTPDGNRIQVIYPQDLWYRSGMLTDEQWNALSKLWHCGNNWWRKSGQVSEKQSGDVVYAYIPFLGSFFEYGHGLDLKNMRSKLEVRMYFNDDITEGGSASITVNEMMFLANEKYRGDIYKIADSKFMNYGYAHNYLDCINVSESKSLSVSTKQYLDLDQVCNKKIAYMILSFRSSTSNSNYGIINFNSLGDITSSVDIVDSANQPLLGGGRAIDTELLRNVTWHKHFPGRMAEKVPIYLITFSEDCSLCNKGVMNGYLEIKNNNYRIAFTPDAAPTQYVQNISCTNAANDDGSYTLKFKEDISQSLAYNANASSIKSNLEAIPSIIDTYGNPTVTASGALTSSATLTWSNNAFIGEVNKNPRTYVIPNNLSDGGVEEIFTSFGPSTYNSSGFVATTYQIDCQVYYWREFHMSHDGRISVNDL